MSEILQSLGRQPWTLWRRQLQTIVRMEQRKNFLTRRGFWIYLLAFAPTSIIALHSVVDHNIRLKDDTLVLAGIFQFYYLRLAIFFGCLGIFTRLIRGEMVERSLHFYLLAPVRREVLVVGKFVAGTITAIWFFGAGVLGSFAFMYVAHGPAGYQYVFDGPGLGQLTSYLAITLLACIGYGALFLLLSIIFRNPIVPGIVLLGWETINPILPSLMQKFSVIFYLRHMTPVDVPAEGVFALLTVVTSPVPAWTASVGVITLATLALVFACRRSRRLEISYTTD
jgi:ABC-type transport system involved in multi-copper enzyme maturation permease subunit